MARNRRNPDLPSHRFHRRAPSVAGRAVAALTGIGLGIGGIAIPSAPAGNATAATPAPAHAASIDTSSQSAVRQAYREWYLPARDVPAGWTGSNDACDPGVNSPESRAAQIEAINYFRAMAGLGAVTENASATAAGQAAALMMSKNQDLDHYPPSTWGCYTDLGAQAAEVANLAWSARPDTGGNTVARYIDDADVQDVGHRLWVLYPGQTQFGLGLTSNTGAMVWGLDADSGWDAIPDVAVPWPAAGYFPSELLPSSRYWSYARKNLVGTGKTVSVTLNGTPLEGVSVVSASPSQGSSISKPDGALVWQMPALQTPEAGAVDTYQVAISGIAPYQVKVFKANAVEIGSVGIVGTATPGAILTAQVNGLYPADAALAYQWLRGETVVGADSTHTVTPEDIGQPLYLRVTAAKPGLSPAQATSPPVTPAAEAASIASVAIAGTPRTGSALTARLGAVTPADADIAYQWLRAGAPVDAKASHTVVAADVGKPLTVRVTAAKAGFATATAESAAVTPQPGAIRLGAVTVAGRAQVGATLTASGGAPNPSAAARAYQWTRNGARIAGATGSAYKAKAEDAGKSIAVTVRATLAGYTAVSATSRAVTVRPAVLTAPTPGMSGRFAVGQTVKAEPGSWTAGAALAYQWLRGGQPIAGAAKASYALQPEDRGQTVAVRVTGSKAGHETAARASAGREVAAGTLKVKKVRVAGRAKVGAKLRAKFSTAPSGAKVKYRWLRAGKAIKGATKARYKLVKKDRRKRISVRVTVSKSGYATARATSRAVRPKQ
ncbi:MAG: CAP domain-containing protein [Bifidobacteriaceae bacterium]|jgi:uncharacterized protein YkwD|nr:CAP domain-containing protein [Bifidobacteriaceae bacterium]